MKSLYLLLFTLAAITCTAQRTHTVANAKLAFIHPKEGIIVKQGDAYSHFNINADIYRGAVQYRVYLEALTAEKYGALQKDAGVLYPAAIQSPNLKKLPQTAFLYKNPYENEAIRYANTDYFAVIGEEEEGKEVLKGTALYFYVQFQGKTLVMLQGDVNGCIVQTRQGYRFFREGGKETYTTVKDNYTFTEDDILSFNAEEYVTDTVKGRVGLRNIFKEIVIPHRYDSIVQSHYFIACYKAKGIDLYNHMLQKLDLPGLRVFIPTNYYIHEVSILQGNTPKQIMVNGKQLKQGRAYVLDEMPSSDDPELADVVKEGNTFYIQSNAVQGLTGNYKQPLSHTEDIDSLYLPFYTISPYIDHSVNVVCCRLKNGKYSIRSLQSVLYDSINGAPYKGPAVENVEKITVEGDFIYFETNGLMGIWPAGTQPRYKKLAGFTNGFARFTLPDGRKGWLSRTGKEYLDE